MFAAAVWLAASAHVGSARLRGVCEREREDPGAGATKCSREQRGGTPQQCHECLERTESASDEPLGARAHNSHPAQTWQVCRPSATVAASLPVALPTAPHTQAFLAALVTSLAHGACVARIWLPRGVQMAASTPCARRPDGPPNPAHDLVSSTTVVAHARRLHRAHGQDGRGIGRTKLSWAVACGAVRIDAVRHAAHRRAGLGKRRTRIGDGGLPRQRALTCRRRVATAAAASAGCAVRWSAAAACTPARSAQSCPAACRQSQRALEEAA